VGREKGWVRPPFSLSPFTETLPVIPILPTGEVRNPHSLPEKEPFNKIKFS
jgi:hypothetical protein